jgi:hypothetical protein
MSQPILKAAAGVAALAAIAFGASAIASGRNDRSSASGPAAPFGAPPGARNGLPPAAGIPPRAAPPSGHDSRSGGPTSNGSSS